MTSREYPKIWGSFERIAKDGSTLTFVVQDVPEALWDEAVEFMLGNYIREDVWWMTAGTAEDSQAIQEYRVLWKSIIQCKMTLACFLNEGENRTIVGVNMCMPQEKDHFVDHNPSKTGRAVGPRIFSEAMKVTAIYDKYDVRKYLMGFGLSVSPDYRGFQADKKYPKTKAGLLSLRMFSEASKVTAIYDKYDVSKYLMGAGLSVAPDYRGLGVAVELLKCRMLLAKEEGFAVTGGIFTSVPAQRSADKAGWECLYQVPYKEFGEQCEIEFNTSTENLKIFAAKVE